MLHLLYALLATARSSLKPQRELALDKDTPERRERESPDGGGGHRPPDGRRAASSLHATRGRTTF